MQESFRAAIPSWDDLRLIWAIAEAGSLAGAAERLKIDPSTVFRRLGQIEAQVGCKLFERHRTGYVLTGLGEEFAAIGETVQARLDALSLKLGGRDPLPSGEVRVTTNDTLLVHLLTPLFAGFRRAYPDIRLDIVLSNQALNLSKRDADVAIRATEAPPDTLVGRRTATIGMAIYGARRDADAFGTPLDPAAHDWIALGDNFAQSAMVRFVTERVPPERIVYRVNTMLGLAEAAGSGIGLALLPCFIADARPDLTRLSPPDPAFGAGLWLLTHPDLRQAARVRALLDYLAAEIGKLKGLIRGDEPLS